MSNAADIKSLEKKIDQANNLYHNFGDSGLSDAEYDALVDRLRALDPTNRRFQRVGSKAQTKDKQPEKWKKYNHGNFKMGSQNKTTTKDGLVKWASKITDNAGWFAQHKLDGTSLKLIFENGKLTLASTRGDGEEGEDITPNVKKMGGIPSSIPDTRKIIFRGEILLYKSKLNLVGGKNTRNTAAGTAKRLDGVGCEHLNVQIYDIMNWEELNLKTVTESLALIKKCGFTHVTAHFRNTVDELQAVKDKYEDGQRDKLDWDIDGLVIKPNKLGSDVWDYPNRSIAYKFEAEEKVTKLIDVEWNDTGGRIAPTGILEPVDIMGVTIQRATLNNVEHIERLGIKIGDLVVVSRRNDVIPCIEKVSVAATNGKAIVPPKVDEDGFPIVHEKNANGDELVYLVSTNPDSSARRRRRILGWYRAHDAKGLGNETIETILDAGIAKDLPEFYDIGMNGDVRLADLDGFGAGKFKVLHQATLLTCKTTLIKFMEGMDLPGFGSSRFEAILEHFGKVMTIQEFIATASDVSKLSGIPGIGENTAKALGKAIADAKPTIDQMLKRVTVEPWSPTKAASTKINGLSFCFTGAMTNDRTDLEKAVKKHGGVVAGVSKKLDYLVVSSMNWTSGKTQKADQLGIKKITEQDFLNMIEGDI